MAMPIPRQLIVWRAHVLPRDINYEETQHPNKRVPRKKDKKQLAPGTQDPIQSS